MRKVETVKFNQGTIQREILFHTNQARHKLKDYSNYARTLITLDSFVYYVTNQ